MKMTVIGCSGSYPGPDSTASCYLVQQEHEGRLWNLVLDLGNGALGPLQRYVDPLKVDAVLISHLHADHCIDMTSYYVLRKFHPSGTQPQIPVWGPSDTANRLSRAYDLPMMPGMREEFEFRVFEGPFAFGPFAIEPVEVDHPVDAFGLRITADGATIGYSGDTGPCEGFDRVAEGAQLLLAEASFRKGDNNPPHLHLTGTDCAEAATKGGAERLVLTHIPPWHDKKFALAEAEAAYDGPVELARPGAVYELGTS